MEYSTVTHIATMVWLAEGSGPSLSLSLVLMSLARKMPGQSSVFAVVLPDWEGMTRERPLLTVTSSMYRQVARAFLPLLQNTSRRTFPVRRTALCLARTYATVPESGPAATATNRTSVTTP